jgi:CSLREA domain-containing protein
VLAEGRALAPIPNRAYARVLGRARAAKRYCFAIFAILVVALAVACPPAALAATIAVTTTADVTANDAQCSIREAIAAANTDSATGGCPAGAGADTVALGPGTYSLDSGDGSLTISSDVTISGAGAATTTIRQAILPARVVEITGGAVTISGLVI